MTYHMWRKEKNRPSDSTEMTCSRCGLHRVHIGERKTPVYFHDPFKWYRVIDGPVNSYITHYRKCDDYFVENILAQ